MAGCTVELPAPELAAAGRSEAPLRLFGVAALWIAGALLAGFAGAVLLGLVIGLHNGFAPHAPRWRLPAILLLVASSFPAQLVLLLAAWRRARIVGRGDRAAGLGSAPVRRPALLAGLALLQALGVIAWATLLLRWLGHPPATASGRLLRAAGADGALAFGTILLLDIGIAPLCEELFFRGWLWTGLARRWRAGPVAVATALPWLALHMLDGGVTRPLFLLPTAITLSLARHHCGGVRASLILHVLNNLAVSAVLAFALLAAHA